MPPPEHSVRFKEGVMFDRTFWRRTLGHAGVYYTIAGLGISVISGIALAIDRYYSENTLFCLIGLSGGMLMLAAGLYLFYGSLMWFDGEGERRSFKSALRDFFAKVRAIPPGEVALVTAPYWLSRIALLLALLYETGSYQDYGLSLLLPFSLYCIIRSLILHFVFRKRIYRNLIALPIDLVVAWLIISVQF